MVKKKLSAFTRASDKPTSSSTSRRSSGREKLFATAVNLKTGEKGFLVDGEIVKKRPSSRSSKRVTAVSTTRAVNPFRKTAVVDITNLETGVRTIEKVDLQKKKIIARKVIQPQEKIVAGVLRQREISPVKRFLTPRVGEKGITPALKGIGASVVGTLTSFVDLAKSTPGALKKISTPPSITNPLTKEQKIARLKLLGVGLIAGAKSFGKSLRSGLTSGSSFQRARTITDIASFFVPVKANFINKAAARIANTNSKFKTVVQATTGRSKTIINTKGLTQGNEAFTQKAILRHDPKQNTVIGNVRTTIKGKTSTQSVNLKDVGGFFVDKKGNKFPKKNIGASNVKVDIKKITTSQTQPNQIIFDGNTVRQGALRDIRVKRIKEVLEPLKKRKLIKERVRESKVELISDLKKAGKKIRPNIDILKLFEKPTKAGKVIRGAATRVSKNDRLVFKRLQSKSGISDIEVKKFLNDINFDKKLIAGLDRRTRLSRALGLRADSFALKKVEAILKEGVGKLKQIKGKIVLKGEEEIIKPILFQLGPSSPKLRLTKRLNKKQIKTLGRVPEKITIPELKFRIKNVRRIAIVKLLAPVIANTIIKRLNARLSVLEKSKLPLITPKKRTLAKKVLRELDKVKHIPKKDIKKKLDTLLKKKFPELQKELSKAKEKVSKITPKRKIIKAAPKLAIAKLKKIPKLKLSFNDRLKKGESFKVDVIVRRLGKVKTLLKGVPLNKGINKGMAFVDKSAGRSFEVLLRGITKAKDAKVNPRTKKFGLRKGRTALKLVEQTKFIRDTLGERKQIRRKRKK